MSVPLLLATCATLWATWIEDGHGLLQGFWEPYVPGHSWRVISALVVGIAALAILAQHPRLGLRVLPLGPATLCLLADLVAIIGFANGNVWKTFKPEYDSGLSLTPNGWAWTVLIFILASAAAALTVLAVADNRHLPLLRR